MTIPNREATTMTLDLLGPTFAARVSLLTLVAGIIGVLLTAGMSLA